jgi:hypothetical protein
MYKDRVKLTVPTEAAFERDPRSSREFITERALAALLQVKGETLRSWRRRGELPPVTVGEDAERYAKAEARGGRGGGSGKPPRICTIRQAPAKTSMTVLPSSRTGRALSTG